MAPCGPWQCRGAEEALVVIRLLCFDTLSVKICRLGPVSTRSASGGFLVLKEAGLRHWRTCLEALEPLKPAEEFVFLCHAPYVTLSKERLTEPRPRGSAREPPSLGGSGGTFSCVTLSKVRLTEP